MSKEGVDSCLEDRSQGERWCSAHKLRVDALLPALCPLCAAPGVRPLQLPEVYSQWWGSRGNGDTRTQPFEAFYCDICAGALQRSQTRYFAANAASLVMTLSFSTALALALGTRLLAGQLVATALFSFFLVLTFYAQGLLRRPFFGLSRLGRSAGDEAGAQRFLCEVKNYADAIRDYGEIDREPIPPRTGGSIGRIRILQLSFALALVNLLWLLLVHTLGVASVRVMVSGNDSAVFLIDSRVFGDVAAANSEDPRSGMVAKVLGGRRNFQLIDEGGRQLVDADINIWPGANYVVGRLPAGKCFYWEERSYGEAGEKHVFFAIDGAGPVWKLAKPVDSWFVGLGSAASQPGGLDVPLSGGMRRALRLLPCTFDRDSARKL